MESNPSNISCFFMGKMVPFYGRRLLVVTAGLIKLITSSNAGCALASRLSSVTIYHQSGHFQQNSKQFIKTIIISWHWNCYSENHYDSHIFLYCRNLQYLFKTTNVVKTITLKNVRVFFLWYFNSCGKRSCGFEQLQFSIDQDSNLFHTAGENKMYSNRK